MIEIFDRLFKRHLKNYIVKVEVEVNTGYNQEYWARYCGYCQLVIPVVAYTRKEAEKIAIKIVNQGTTISSYAKPRK